jgi:hypothetical protein
MTIGGAAVTSTATYDVANPADESVVAQAPDDTP